MTPSPSQILLDNVALWGTPDKPWDLVSDTVQQAISPPLGSHDAVHALQTINMFRGTENPIHEFLEESSLRHKLCTLWNYDGLQCAKRQQQIIFDTVIAGKHDLYDLQLCGILNCSQCYRFLFGCEKPDKFFFTIAIKGRTMDERDHVLFAYPLDVLFEFCSYNQEWFMTCYRQFPSAYLGQFSQRGMHNIFQFIGIDVGEWLLNQGLSLEGCPQPCWAEASHLIDIDTKAVQISPPEGAKSCWSGVMLQEDPLPMLDWLGVHGPPLPDDYLVDATIGLCIPTVRWLLRHEKVSFAEWKEAACAAMQMDNPRAAMMLEVILRSPHPEVSPEMSHTFSRYLMKELRESAYMTMYKWSWDKEKFLSEYAERMRVISKVEIGISAFQNKTKDILDKARKELQDAIVSLAEDTKL
ncbi:hypothetical protein N7451_010926 [Penicillium sp. IBT 35674x]|nr:hypothetical protein N7451_010926 [Penicillium sp. IBT 35674x]